VAWCLAALQSPAASSSYSIVFQPGYTAFANHLNHPGGNGASQLFPNAPPGTTIIKYNGGFTVYQYGDLDLMWVPSEPTINPGEGAFLHTSTTFSNIFFGTPATPVPPPSVAGRYVFLSDQRLETGSWDTIIGTAPVEGAQVLVYDVVHQADPAFFSNYVTYNFHQGAWQPSTPVIPIGVSAFFTIQSNPPPAITSQPLSTTNVVGATVGFSVGASGAAPLAYQWWRNGAVMGGASSSSVTVTNIQPADDQSSFFATVSNPYGTTTSAVAVLTVTNPIPMADLSVSVSLSSGLVAIDDNLILSVLVSNKGPSTSSRVMLTDWLPAGVYFRSATADQGQCDMTNGVVTCTLSNVAPGGTSLVTLIVRPTAAGPLTNICSVAALQADPNGADNAATSSAMAYQRYIVIANAGTNGIVSPAGEIDLAAGQDQSFSATPAPGFAVYQWLLSDLSALRSDEVVVATGTSLYLVTNIQSDLQLSVTFRPAGEPPLILADPESQSANEGTNVTLTVAASGDAPLAYQWFFEDNPIAGATDSALALSSVSADQTGDYQVLVSNLVDSVFTTRAFLSVRSLHNITITAGPNGSVTPAGLVQMYDGEDLLLVAAPALNFTFDQWLIDGQVAQTGGDQLRLSQVDADHTVSISFRPVVPCAGLGINFMDLDNGGGAPVPPESLAGVRPQGSWINVGGASGAMILSNGVSFNWQAERTGSLPIPLVVPDSALMQGYLDSSGANTTVIQVHGLTFASYDVYVYCDGDNGGELRVGRYSLNASATRFAQDDPSQPPFLGTYVEATSTNGGAGAMAGNYVVFRAVAGSDFIVTARGDYTSGATLSAPVNGIQVVPAGQTPVSQVQFGSVGMTQGNLALNLSAPPGTSVLIERSADLIQWDTWQVLDNTNGTVQAIDSITNYDRMFYRARLVPPELQDGPLSFAGMSPLGTNALGSLVIYSNLQNLVFSFASSGGTNDLDTGVILASTWHYTPPSGPCPAQLDFQAVVGDVIIGVTIVFDLINDAIVKVQKVVNGVVTEAIYFFTTVKLDVDTDRDGVVDRVKDQKGKAKWTKDRGAIYNVNFNRDGNNKDGADPAPDAIRFADNGDPVEIVNAVGKPEIENEEDAKDLAPLMIRKVLALKAGAKAFLKVDQLEDIQSIHVYPAIKAKATAIWGSIGDRLGGVAEPKEVEITSLISPDQDTQFGIEGLFYRNVGGDAIKSQAFRGEIDLTLEVRAGARVIGSDKVHLKVAPWMMLPHTNPSLEIWSRDGTSSDSLNDKLKESRQLKKSPEPRGQWFQDHVEIGFTQRPTKDAGGRRVHSVFRLPYQSATQPLWPVKSLLEAKTGVFQIGQLAGDSGDFGGDLELLPPGDYLPNTLGRIVVGTTRTDKFWNFLVSQEIQNPFTLPTQWLYVGHVDETITFSDNPGEVIIADPTLAYTLMNAIAAGDRGKSVFFAKGAALPQSGAASVNATNDTDHRIDTGVDHRGKSWKYIRIYDDSASGSKAAGQVGRIKNLENGYIIVDKVWDTRGAITPDTMKAAPRTAGKWHVKPQKNDAYVLVEDTQLWKTGTPAFITVFEVLADADLEKLNKIDAQGVLNDIKTALQTQAKAKPGVPDPLTFVSVPVIFAGQRANFANNEMTEAFTPGLANAQPVGGKIYFAKQFGPRNSDGDDIFEKTTSSAIPTAEFADEWDAYHAKIGEVHCGTVTKRRFFAADWWKKQP
jgi:uncharacterized repeat protein (TIGR01451 family)